MRVYCVASLVPHNRTRNPSLWKDSLPEGPGIELAASVVTTTAIIPSVPDSKAVYSLVLAVLRLPRDPKPQAARSPELVVSWVICCPSNLWGIEGSLVHTLQALPRKCVHALCVGDMDWNP